MARNIRTDETRRDYRAQVRYNTKEKALLLQQMAEHGYADISKYIREVSIGQIEGKAKATPDEATLIKALHVIGQAIEINKDETVKLKLEFMANMLHTILPKHKLQE
jgi:hypothetical protein